MNNKLSDAKRSRSERVQIDRTCTVLPWNVTATLVNVSSSGALLLCDEPPDEMYLVFEGQILIDGCELHGDFVRIEAHQIAMMFSQPNGDSSKVIDSLIHRARVGQRRVDNRA